MDNDKLLSSLSKHIAYWYTSVKGEKDIIFPIDQVSKSRAEGLFKDRYHKADIIISEHGSIYKISKEICCESNTWSFTYYLDDMKKNYRLKKTCKEILPYGLNSTNQEKFEKICKLNIPIKIIVFKINSHQVKIIKEKISPYLKCLTYINSKKKEIVAFPDVVIYKENEMIVLLNYYHHHNMKRQIKRITNIVLKYQNNNNINVSV